MFRVLTCLATEHDWRLVIVAGVVCFLASVTAINLFNRARATMGRASAIWIIAAGAATGSGIWATHFIAMLAYNPGFSIAYNIGLTTLSFVAAATVTGIGLSVAVYGGRGSGAAVGGGIVGAGVACMHYLGMWAVELPGRVTWSLDLVAASIILGMLFGMAALVIAARRNDARSILIAALLLTLAIVSHHFTAMGAVEIVPDPTRVITALSLSPISLAVAVASVAMAVLGMSLVSAFADRRLGEKGLLLATALNNMTQGVVMFDSGQRLVVCNDRYIEMYKLSSEIVKPGCTLQDIIQYRIASGSLARDPEQYRTQVVSAMARGQTMSWVAEQSDGRAISVVNRPITGGQYWVGTHDDITERRMAERKSASLAEQEDRRAAVDAAIQSFRDNVETVLKAVGDSVAAMRSIATELSTSSGETSKNTAGAVHASQMASTNVETAAIAADELAKSIMEISRQLSQAADVVRGAVVEAETTNDEIARLAQAAQKIGDVVKLIQNIAKQTNLLALNATIEAARAGESGRGFAVVASEVKSLAVQTAKATEEITSQVLAVQESTSSAVEAIRRITGRMLEIDQYTSAVAASVEQQNAATGQISRNVTNATQGTRAVVSVLDKVAGAITKSSVSADTVLKTSQTVEAAATTLREKVEGFLRKVAA
jgi:methyl-accepting chemotaxis protein